ncbi:hypothetical protein KAW38_00155 [Candidatus Micrarchaeota archaeon]|nr:hypothetical protein [Candidatus Micrarchaeota archaeon]
MSIKIKKLKDAVNPNTLKSVKRLFEKSHLSTEGKRNSEFRAVEIFNFLKKWNGLRGGSEKGKYQENQGNIEDYLLSGRGNCVSMTAALHILSEEYSIPHELHRVYIDHNGTALDIIPKEGETALDIIPEGHVCSRINNFPALSDLAYGFFQINHQKTIILPEDQFIAFLTDSEGITPNNVLTVRYQEAVKIIQNGGDSKELIEHLSHILADERPSFLKAMNLCALATHLSENHPLQMPMFVQAGILFNRILGTIKNVPAEALEGYLDLIVRCPALKYNVENIYPEVVIHFLSDMDSSLKVPKQYLN